MDVNEESRKNPLTNDKSQNPPRKNQQKSSKCLVYIMITLVLMSIILLVFGLVVLRNNTSLQLRISHITVRNLHYASTPMASLNTTMHAELQVKNQNFGPFEFPDSNTTLLYGNVTIGDGNICGRRVEIRGRKRMNVSMQVRANGELLKRVNGNLNLSRDIESRLVKLNSHAKLRGEVRLLKIIKRQRTAGMNCSMTLNLTSQEIQDLSCQ